MREQEGPGNVSSQGLPNDESAFIDGWTYWLPGQDSNLRPIGYERPDISIGLGLSHHPPDNQGRVSGACEALLDGLLSL